MVARDAPKIGGIVLAAGGSSRLGRPKQFLQFKSKSLLRHAAQTMAASICDPIVVVLGAESDEAAAQIKDLPVATCLNENWRLGMSSSIKVGLAKLIEMAPEIDAVLISLCDQPFITSEILNRFSEKFAVTDVSIVAAKYNEVNGVPALFSRELFIELSRLEGDKGARDLIRSLTDLATINLPEAAFDIDSPQDFEYLSHLLLDR